MKQLITGCLLGSVLVAGTAHAQVFDTYAAMASADARVLQSVLGSGPDALGMVGSNSHLDGNTSGSGNFTADEQRGAIDSMFAAIALEAEWEAGKQITVPQSLCDWYVAQGMSAIQACYKVQQANGDFPSSISESTTASTLTGTGDGYSWNMGFFLAYSNNALIFLLRNPHYNGIWGTAVSGLYPGIKAAMDYFYAPDGSTPAHSYTGTGNLSIDFPVPNRTMCVALALSSGAALLQGTSYNANIGNYRTEAQWWVNNEFVSSSYFTTPRALFDAQTGVFREGGVSNGDAGYGYDSSYQAVACRFFFLYLGLYPHDIGSVATVGSDLQLAGHWLAQRILKKDSLTGDPGSFYDDTLSTRTGPTGGWAENKVTDFDSTSARFALSLYDGLVNQWHPAAIQTEGMDSALRIPSLVSNPSRAPVIFNSPNPVVLAVGTPMAVYHVMATNAGQISTSTQYEPADSGFSVAASGLPAGLSLGAAYNPYPNLGYSATSGTVNGSVGYADITGTPTLVGTYNVLLTPTNTLSIYTYSSSPPNSTPPTLVTAGTQTGTPVTIAFTVANQTTLNTTADAFVRDGTYASDNYGVATDLNVRASTSGFNRCAYFLFSTSGVAGTIDKAVLQVYGDYGTDSSQNYCDVQCCGIPNPSWTEGTQNNNPDSGGGIDWTNQPAAGSLIDTVSVPQFSAGYNQWDVTSWVIAQRAAGATNMSFVLKGAVQTAGGCDFDSRENSANKPAQLILYYH